MTQEFRVEKEIELDASPERVWDAIATGPGITSWFMSHEVVPGEGGVVRLTVDGYEDDASISEWDPPRRLAYQNAPSPDGTFSAIEWLVEGREGGSCVLRFVHSGMIAGDWAAEYEAGTAQGWTMYLHTLAQYVIHFPGRYATYVVAEGPKTATDQHQAWTTLLRALDLVAPKVGDEVRFDLGGFAPIEGVVDYDTGGYPFLAVRSEDGLYRFHVKDDGVDVGHHLFTEGLDRKESERAWGAWLATVYS